MPIGGYSINGYYGYFIGGYWCLLLVIILMAISGYYINGYWWLFVVILLMVMGGYSIDGYSINGY